MPEMMQVMTCRRCGCEWARPAVATRRPRLCPECLAMTKIPRQRSSDEDRQKAMVVDDKHSPAYSLIVKHADYVSAMVLAYRAIRAKDYDLAERTLFEVIPQGRQLS